MFNLILLQTIQLAFRKGGGALGCVGFYVVIFTLFAFALSPEAMKQYALAVMTVSLVLANVTALPLIFARDEEEGVLEQYILKSDMLELVVLAKMLGSWCVHLLPILVCTPLLSLMAGLELEQGIATTLRLLLLSPSIAAIGVLTAAFTIDNRRGGILPALISLPLTMPLIIFASSAGGDADMLLTAAALASVPACSYVSAALLKIA